MKTNWGLISLYVILAVGAGLTWGGIGVFAVGVVAFLLHCISA